MDQTLGNAGRESLSTYFSLSLSLSVGHQSALIISWSE